MTVRPKDVKTYRGRRDLELNYKEHDQWLVGTSYPLFLNASRKAPRFSVNAPRPRLMSI